MLNRWSPPAPPAAPAWLQLAWAGGLLGLACVLAWLATLTPTVSLPLLLGALGAFVLHPAVVWLERRWGLSSNLAIVVLLSVVVTTSLCLFMWAGPRLNEELSQLPDKVEAALESGLAWAREHVRRDVPADLGSAAEALKSEVVDEVKESGPQALAGPATSIVGLVAGSTVLAVRLVALLLLTPMFTWVFLTEAHRLRARLVDLIPPRAQPAVLARGRELEHILGGYLRGQVVVSLILSVLYAMGLGALGLPLSLAVAVFSGFANMVPFLGTLTGLLIALALGAVEWGPWTEQSLGVVGVFTVVTALETFMITPRVVGHQVDLSPAVVIASCFAMGELFGVAGVLLAIPTAAVLKVLLATGLGLYRSSSWFPARPAELRYPPADCCCLWLIEDDRPPELRGLDPEPAVQLAEVAREERLSESA